jgi:1-acyl-sn-glycerol-3-phosphate acyltransferase
MTVLLRSITFLLWFAALSIVMAILFLPVLVLPRRATVWMARRWCALTLWGLNVFATIGFEMRGTKPQTGVLVAAKHMSMWDTLTLYLLLDDPAMILKRSLFWVPFFGWYAWKAGSIGINREGGAAALRAMMRAAHRAIADGRRVVIFPEGSRKKPGTHPDYKPGVAGIYGLLSVACVPVALNSGQFWTGFRKRPGTIILEFLAPIPAGLARDEFMRLLEERIEAATGRLLAEGRRPNEPMDGLEH